MTLTVYVLLCEKGRYYVGKTDRPINNRIEEHFNSNGLKSSEWTRLYKPIKVIETKCDADEFDEDKFTKKYMKKYGIDKVRGGSYTQINLPSYSLKSLEKELCSACNLCFRCNRSGHFANQCYAKTKLDGTIIEDDEDDEDEKYIYCCDYCHIEFNTEYEAEKHERYCNQSNACYRCGRLGHFIEDCFASTHLNGKRLS